MVQSRYFERVKLYEEQKERGVRCNSNPQINKYINTLSQTVVNVSYYVVLTVNKVGLENILHGKWILVIIVM